jgi:ketosteroid isomerase-like protein
VAFCHSLKRVSATAKTGQRLEMSWRATICFREINGAWRVTQEHASVPFDMASGRALPDVEP